MASSSSQTTSSTRIELFTTADLSARPTFLHILVEFINLAFSGKDGFPVPRFLSDNGLVESLGEQGLCAVMFDQVTDEPIATASTKLWGTNPVRQDGMIIKNAIAALFTKVIQAADEAKMQAHTDFELSTVAALTAYRGKGFADQCVQAVELATAMREGRESTSKKELTLWLRAIEHHNGAYWIRRGFEPVESCVGPKGMWGAERDFVVVTMKRPIESA